MNLFIKNVCLCNYQMIEVQQLCVSEEKLGTHEKPSSRQTISVTLFSSLLNLQQHFQKSTQETRLLQFIFPLIAPRCS